MINLPSAIKLLFYLLQCAISYTLLFIGHGFDIFDNLDVFLNCEEEDSTSKIPTIWTALPALALWVLALYLVSVQLDQAQGQTVGALRYTSFLTFWHSKSKK